MEVALAVAALVVGIVGLKPLWDSYDNDRKLKVIILDALEKAASRKSNSVQHYKPYPPYKIMYYIVTLDGARYMIGWNDSTNVYVGLIGKDNQHPKLNPLPLSEFLGMFRKQVKDLYVKSEKSSDRAPA